MHETAGAGLGDACLGLQEPRGEADQAQAAQGAANVEAAELGVHVVDVAGVDA
jgi:hypothetical protein